VGRRVKSLIGHTTPPTTTPTTTTTHLEKVLQKERAVHRRLDLLARTHKLWLFLDVVGGHGLCEALDPLALVGVAVVAALGLERAVADQAVLARERSHARPRERPLLRKEG